MSAEPGARAATVAGGSVTVASVRAHVAALRAGPSGRHLPPQGSADERRLERWVAQALVARVVVEHEAAALGTARTGASALPVLRERVTAGVAVPEAHVRACYEASPERYRRPERRRVRHVLLHDEAAARAVAERARAGEPIARLAEELSEDALSRRGGGLGELRRGELVGAFEDAVFACDAGGLVGPVRSAFGWHVARVEAVHPETRTPYAEVRAELHAQLLDRARRRAFASWLAQRTAALARFEPDWLHPGDPRSPGRSHRH